MKKTIVLIIGIIFSVIIFINLVPNTISVENVENENYKEQVEDILNGFYGERYGAFEISYGNSNINESERFYDETYPLFMDKDYEGILQYLAFYNVLIVEDHLFDVEK